MSNYSNIFVLIPSLNPDNNLISLVNELSKNKWGGILVVDDGSSQNARKIFNDITKIKGVNVVSHTENKGKGSALKTGMKYIKNHANNIEGIITVDADGQHLVKDVEKIAALVWYNRKIYKVYWEDGMIQFKAQRGSKSDDETFKTIGKLEKWFNNMSVKPNPKKMYGKR